MIKKGARKDEKMLRNRVRMLSTQIDYAHRKMQEFSKKTEYFHEIKEMKDQKEIRKINRHNEKMKKEWKDK